VRHRTAVAATADVVAELLRACAHWPAGALPGAEERAAAAPRLALERLRLEAVAAALDACVMRPAAAVLVAEQLAAAAAAGSCPLHAGGLPGAARRASCRFCCASAAAGPAGTTDTLALLGAELLWWHEHLSRAVVAADGTMVVGSGGGRTPWTPAPAVDLKRPAATSCSPANGVPRWDTCSHEPSARLALCGDGTPPQSP
jgi:hypothetical protein